MSEVPPMTLARRLVSYTGRSQLIDAAPRLTPAQCRRIEHKNRKAARKRRGGQKL